jgi:hypothetical protein
MALAGYTQHIAQKEGSGNGQNKMPAYNFKTINFKGEKRELEGSRTIGNYQV